MAFEFTYYFLRGAMHTRSPTHDVANVVGWLVGWLVTRMYCGETVGQVELWLSRPTEVGVSQCHTLCYRLGDPMNMLA